jgi:hypothetical protein
MRFTQKRAGVSRGGIEMSVRYLKTFFSFDEDKYLGNQVRD